MKTIKCAVWDLDNTVWKGILLEDSEVSLNPDAAVVIKALDSRGILNSVASRNDLEAAKAKLVELGLWDYFLYPQINWNSKDSSVAAIAEKLRIATDTFAFIDDQPFDREEVSFTLPDVRTYDASVIPTLAGLPEFNPVVTEEASSRRLMYMAEIRRDEEEAEYSGPKEEFLAGLGMNFRIFPAREQDLARAEELTVRTNQLNTTGRTYSLEELRAFTHSSDHILLMAELEDRFGTYGKIGLALIEKSQDKWILKLLLMSCRVLSRGVGAVLLNHMMRSAEEAGAGLVAEIIPNDRNRMMLVTLRLAGFKESGRDGDLMLLENTKREVPPAPGWLNVDAVRV